jgi:hypothetical protein
MMKRSLIFLVLVCLLLTGCASAAATSVAPSTGGAPMPPSFNEAVPAEKSADAQSQGAVTNQNDLSNSGSGGNQAAIDRVVIKNASLVIVVADPAAAMGSITQMADEMGGFVVNSNLVRLASTGGMEVPEANITVRVPAQKLTDAMDRIKGLVTDKANDIQSENVTGQDVTKEYTDLQSRLTNLENTRDQLQTIMADAHKTEDILAVYNQLTSVTEQIEVLKGQIRYYDESASLSAISVRIVSKESVKPISIGGWQPKGIARDALQALVNTLQVLGTAAIWGGIYCLPITLMAAIPLYLIFLGFRKVQRRKKATPPANTKIAE